MGRPGQVAGGALGRVGLHVEDMADPPPVAEAAEPLLDQPIVMERLSLSIPPTYTWDVQARLAPQAAAMSGNMAACT
jgi:hypothetical protein